MKHSLETVFGTHMVQFPEEIQRAQKRLPDVHTYEGFFSLSTCSLYAIIEMLRKKNGYYGAYCQHEKEARKDYTK